MTKMFILVASAALAACAGDTGERPAAYPAEATFEEPTAAPAQPGPMERQPVAGTELETRERGTAGISDQEFVTQAVSAGMFEVQSSQAAMQQGNLGAMNDFAQKMVTDHAAANEKLESIARAQGFTVPDQMVPQHQQLLDRIQAANASEISSVYHQIQETAHQQTIQLFERCAQGCNNPELRNFAETTLPTLREHKDMLGQGHGAHSQP